jgi:hypothetical protein
MPHPDPRGLDLDEREDGGFTIKAEIWGMGTDGTGSPGPCDSQEHPTRRVALLPLRNGDRALQASRCPLLDDHCGRQARVSGARNAECSVRLFPRLGPSFLYLFPKTLSRRAGDRLLLLRS